MFKKLAKIVLVAALASPLAVYAEDNAAALVRADQAFAAADYPTALSIYKKLEPQITDQSKLESMRERMRYATKAIAEPREAPATQPTPAARVPHTRPADGQTLEITLHELGNFDYSEENDSAIPDDVKKLSGCHVKIPGQMLPLDQTGKVTRFILVNDMMSCCYGTAPKLQNIVYVNMPAGKWIAPTTERITIEGTLKVEVKKEDGFVLSLFEVDPSSVKFAAQ